MDRYEAVETFKDTDGTIFEKDKEYTGTDEERIQQLLTNDNKCGRPFIRKVDEQTRESENEQASTDDEQAKKYPNHVGGGHYELSNGDKVQGKDKAIEAEQALKE